MKKYITVFILILISASVYAQQIGNFAAIDVLTGKSVSLSDFKSSAGAVVIFTSNAVDCPYDQYYSSRLQKIAKEFGGKIPVIFVNAHAKETESPESMKSNASKLGSTYLVDSDQSIMKSLKATKSPEVFVLKNAGGNFSIFYHGAIDDNAQVQTDVRENYLTDAINALLSDQQPKNAEVRPVGCVIRKK